ncbi:hypothetical protein GIB67_022200 [Kingdonia uniflora]|uniref:Caffeic acid O-methyltransferase n=1 Tax=Kingdonia uniflora TaxID=39325 RepID=A0A7J7P6X9_9MAGN|nr:hypothetical protein GIB67_000231 [Kingdonia uniflora]KAF6175197.1 hypothetical protein GIB67_022200 [Kingdonia uniflora]
MATLENQTQTSCKNEEEEACSYAMQLASISVLPMVLKSTIELDVLEIIAKSGPGACISPSEIASKLPTTKNPEAHVMLDRMLRLLASYKVLTCTMHTLEDGHVERLYGLAPVCKFLVRNEDGVSIVPFMLLNQDKVIMKSWYYLKDAVIDGGIPFYKAHGMGLFDYHATDSRFNMFFNKVMSNQSMIFTKKILEMYKGFEGSETIVDVAGGTGTTLKMIISKYPTIKGVNFDLPHSVIHNWSDERSLKCLKNCYAALPEDGKVIIVEAIAPEFPETNSVANSVFHIDCIMLATLSGGKERTEKEFEALAKEAGFADFQVISCAYNNWVMEFRKMK